MIALLTTAAWAADPNWAGVPLADLPALGLAAPGFSAASPEWRAAWGTAGFVRVHLAPDVAAAEAAFAGLRRTAGSLWPVDSPAGVPGDQVAGDAELGLLVRDRNVVFYATNAAGGCDDLVAALRGRLVTAAPPGTTTVELAGDTVVVDAVGRKVAGR